MARNTADVLMTLPPMHSPAVMQYITTALGQFPPESLCVYLPPFVPGLRHATPGTLQDYILVLCSKNVLLTHQLLW